MDIFQVYNREKNSWNDENIRLIPAWSENWVIDKTTDSLSVKLKYLGNEKPNWRKGDWCRMLHLSGDDAGATYTPVYTYNSYDKPALISWDIVQVSGGYQVKFSTNNEESLPFEYYVFGDLGGNVEVSSKAWVWKGNDFILDDVFTSIDKVVVDSAEDIVYIPKNHEQFIIKDITIVKDYLNDEFDIQLALVEPIEMANGILCETMSFTNQISKVVDNVTYSHEPLNHYSVLEKILKVTPANNDDYENSERKYRKAWFNRIKIVDGLLLRNIPFNDETYSEPSLYEILLNKYDSSVKRTPVIYFDMAENDVPNNLDRTEYILQFERQDGFGKKEVELDSLLENNTQVIHNYSGENFVDGVVSNYDNLSPNTNIYTPAQELWAIPQVNSNERKLTDYITPLAADWVIVTPHNIKSVKSVVRYLYKPRFETSGVALRTYFRPSYEVLDYSQVLIDGIKHNAILSEKQYIADNKFYKKTNCVWYIEGDNKLHINEVYYDTLKVGSLDDNTSNLWVYQIIYEPLVSGRYDLGLDNQTPINQVDAQVDSEKFSEYLKSYVQSTNKSDLIIHKTLENFNDIYETGTRVVKDNKNYIITSVGIQNRGYEYDVIYQLNENHFRKNDSIEPPKEIRKNIEISIDSTKERKSMFTQKIKLSLNEVNKESVFDKKDIISSLLTNYDISKYPQILMINIKSDNPFVSGYEKNIKLLCEIARYTINNTICFNFRFLDNAEAGKEKYIQLGNVNVTVGVGLTSDVNIVSVPSSQIPILYTDIFGEFNKFDVSFCSINIEDLTKLQIGDSEQSKVDYGNMISKVMTTMSRYPVPQDDLITEDNVLTTINGINYYKDMLDTFNYTIGVHVETDDNMILSDNLLKNSILMTSTPKQLKYIQFYDRNVDLNDIKDINNDTTLYNVQSSVFEDNCFTITFAEHNKCKSVVLLDEDENPLIIFNDFDKTIIDEKFSEIKIYC